MGERREELAPVGRPVAAVVLGGGPQLVGLDGAGLVVDRPQARVREDAVDVPKLLELGGRRLAQRRVRHLVRVVLHRPPIVRLDQRGERVRQGGGGAAEGGLRGGAAEGGERAEGRTFFSSSCVASRSTPSSA